jgi:hypothetical protein
MFGGRLKTPDPIIEPMTTAVSAPSPSFREARAVLSPLSEAVFIAILVPSLV